MSPRVTFQLFRHQINFFSNTPPFSLAVAVIQSPLVLFSFRSLNKITIKISALQLNGSCEQQKPLHDRHNLKISEFSGMQADSYSHAI